MQVRRRRPGIPAVPNESDRVASEHGHAPPHMDTVEMGVIQTLPPPIPQPHDFASQSIGAGGPDRAVGRSQHGGPPARKDVYAMVLPPPTIPRRPEAAANRSRVVSLDGKRQ